MGGYYLAFLRGAAFLRGVAPFLVSSAGDRNSRTTQVMRAGQKQMERPIGTEIRPQILASK
ncbi:MAG: hypothetical protein RI897_3755 [Verrucomicrobiota bacterium]